ncbi:hypothetical protein [Dyadobacter frigoris]|uniref:Uncharacterized protein n=1 Tax=Dyadobacter frigoris TaxID=2576211 RepID=A0A4U6DCR1_9BACT|nr:hypothetical protein [Dyadobacter frigoris]TKT94157.1 hypothetical protein FDK13_02795 [Dyadobacter frigoris]
MKIRVANTPLSRSEKDGPETSLKQNTPPNKKSSRKIGMVAVLLILSFTAVFGQQKTLGKFIITDAKINNVDLTESYLANEGYIAFYTSTDGNLSMVNTSKKANIQSYGRLLAVTQRVSKETKTQYESNVFSFKWRYKNTYDSKSGTASVRFQKVYKPQGTTFICAIIPENLDVMIFKGYMEGSLDFSDYIK